MKDREAFIQGTLHHKVWDRCNRASCKVFAPQADDVVLDALFVTYLPHDLKHIRND